MAGWTGAGASTLAAYQLALALFLLPSGAAKLTRFPRFVAGVRQYQLIPEPIATPVAIAIVAAELTCGLAFAAAAAPLPVASIAVVMFSVFGTAMALAIRRRREIDCSCYQLAGYRRVGAATLARNGALAMYAFTVLILTVTLVPRSGWFAPTVGWDSASVHLLVPVFIQAMAVTLFVYLLEWVVAVRGLRAIKVGGGGVRT